MSKIVVAMSGGVDSSVAAALLKAQGHQVTGMMLRLWSEAGREEQNRCCSPYSMQLARRAAAVLDIPFFVVDAKDAFRKEVVQYFLDGYASGGTPNPCLECNRLIKWDLLLKNACDLGAEKMATGHYVRLHQTPDHLLGIQRAVDRAKDQSYVLYWMTQDLLAKSLFPLGDMTKEKVRALAEEFHLPTAQRADSQDLCFLSGEDYRLFIRRHAPEAVKPGLILDRKGMIVGEHAGLLDYTIGQRKGIPVPSAEPLYVIGKNARENSLLVGAVSELGSIECTVKGLNWISGQPPQSPFRAGVKTRYTAKEVVGEVTLLEGEDRARLRIDTVVRDLTGGQAAVFYTGDDLLGGGLIE